MPEEDEPTPEEWAAIEAADVYLDAIGNRRDFVGDQLGATEWRKDVDAEPFDWGQTPSAHIARGELPPAPPSGGTLSIAEHAARLYVIGNDEAPATGAATASENLTGIPVPDLSQTVVGPLQEGQSSLESHVSSALACVGDGSDHQEIGGAGEAAKQAYATALAAASAAAAKATEMQAALKGAQEASTSAEGATRAFLAVVKQIAQKHGG
ncbi:hypothetical protein ACWEF6_02770 [Amycolatopsis sp. NPDC004772]